MLVKGLYYVKLKMFGQISGARCYEHYQILAGICVRFRFGRQALFGNFFRSRIRFLHFKILGYLLLYKERFYNKRNQKQLLYLQLYKSFSQNILTFCIQVKKYVTIPIQGMCFKMSC